MKGAIMPQSRSTLPERAPHPDPLPRGEREKSRSLHRAGRACRRCRRPIRVPGVPNVRPRAVDATVNGEVVAAVDRRTGRIDDGIGPADPAGVAIDAGARDGSVLEREAGRTGPGRVFAEE